ncbi:MAG: DUF1508 domain-containing protein [Pseudomonadales bacterium]|nr:DUF1508 domain-containing protein [Pseudomonadales bacterium]
MRHDTAPIAKPCVRRAPRRAASINEQYSFDLEAGNHQTILTSWLCSSKSATAGGIESSGPQALEQQSKPVISLEP